jgi:hypothetical protein
VFRREAGQPRIQQGSFANTGFPGDKDHLPCSALSLAPPRVQLRQLRVPPYQQRQRAPRHPLQSLRLVPSVASGHRREKAIPTPVHGLDELRRPGRLTKRPAQFPDTHGHHRLTHGHVRPDAIEQRALGHDLPRLFDQHLQHGARLGRKPQGVRVTPDNSLGDIEPKRAKGEHAHLLLGTAP